MSLSIEIFSPEATEWHQAAASLSSFQAGGGTDEATAYVLVRLLVRRNNQPVAILTLYRNPDLTEPRPQTLFAGTFAVASGDKEATALLFEKAAAIAQREGATQLIGPLNGSTWHPYRLPVWSSGHRYFLTELVIPTQNVDLWTDAGFCELEVYTSRSMPIPPTKTFVLPDALADRGIFLRPLAVGHWDAEMRLLYPLCGAAFQNARFFSPISEAAFVKRHLKLHSLVDPRLTLVAQDVAGTPKAFFLAFPDMLDPRRETVILKSVARHPASKTPGLIETMVTALNAQAYTLGYRRIIHAFMHEAARSTVHSVAGGGETIRRYALFARDL